MFNKFIGCKKRMVKHQKLDYLLLIFLQIIPVYLEAASSCTEWVAKVVSVQGKIETKRFGESNWKKIQQGDVFCQGDKIRSERNSRATLQLSNNSLISVDQNTNLNFSIPKVEAASSSLIDIIKGSAFFRSRESQRLNIETPFINAVHEGTEFLVTVDSEKTEITVFDGQVAASNQQGKIHIKKGFTGIAKKGEAPRVKALTIRPEDAVQWTLYYPPIVDYQHLKSAVFKPAIDTYEKGNIYQALDILKDISADQRDADYLVLKSSLLLTVGRVEDALELIKQARTLKQDESSAIALQSVIAVTKNRQDEALKLAQQAVTLNPQSTIAQIALSYAYQSNFKIEPALQASKEAIHLSPDNALAWARLSELQLSTGERSDALESAKKAQILNPQLDRTQTILGFANLAEVDIDEAKTAFNQAIKLNSADPLARLGLGLAKIREGDVEEGTSDLETAVSLDPDNAITRSYLGKAYYELKNDGYAGTELAIAKEMDANDPTPWFYDAIRKQTTNRPVEALHDMQKAIELNDNRGVYRSKLLLDEDLAARSASLGRIYNDLGFQQLGLVQGWKSVNADPSNYSAHRLLADNYASRPRHEIARVSELLQSQLLQPINVNPIQPSLAESNLLILNGSGSSNTSFNEFNPLFERNRLALQASGLYGSNNTWGEEVVQSGLWKNFSYSLGQFHYETDGYRKNNDLKRDIYNIFLQGAITSNINVQAEFRRTEREQGDLHQYFDRDKFKDGKRREIQKDTARLGIRLSTSPESTFIFSGQYSDLLSEVASPPASIAENKEGYQMEVQYLFQHNWLNTVVGGGTYHFNGTELFKIDLPNNPPDQFSEITDSHTNAYIYSNWTPLKPMTWTFGLSYDSVDTSSNPNLEKINPKIGLQWQLIENLRLRVAYFQTVKRSLLTDQTIEPTQIAGFNQFFDDFNGTVSKRYGVGLDAKFSTNFSGGIEYSQRDLKFDSFPEDTRVTNNRKEELVRGYLYWTPLPSWSARIEAEFEGFKRSSIDPFVVNEGEPAVVKTFSLPLGISYFHSSGFFSEIEGTYVHQKVDYPSTSNSISGKDDFFLLDAKIGYRFPRRLGSLSIVAKNLFDTEFSYEDSSIQTQREENNSRFIPGVAVFMNLTLAF